MKFLDFNAPIEKSKRDLPHWEQSGCTYFITYRMADSVPAVKLQQHESERKLWLNDHPKPWDEATWKEYSKCFEGPIQQWLDQGHGSCALREPELRNIVAQSFHHFDGQRYQLGDYIIMPNHVHLIFTPSAGFEVKSLLHTWKSYTAKQIQKASKEAPTHFWQHESYDHIVRSPKQLSHYQNYIRENPIKARLPEGSWTHWEAPRE